MGRHPKRALRDEDKASKKQHLLQSAAKLLQKNRPEDITMERIARTARVAKGTLYRYFQTKEEMFLEIHRMDYEAWFTRMTDFLLEQTEIPPERLASWIVQAIKDNERFAQLHSITSTFLENNIGEAQALAFKRTMRSSVERVAPELQRVLNLTSVEESFLFLTHLHALLVGLWAFGHPSALMERMISASDELALFRLDFYAAYEHGLCLLIRGMNRR